MSHAPPPALRVVGPSPIVSDRDVALQVGMFTEGLILRTSSSDRIFLAIQRTGERTIIGADLPSSTCSESSDRRSDFFAAFRENMLQGVAEGCTHACVLHFSEAL